MKINDIKKALPFLFEAKITPMLQGPHGIGKSQIIKQYCAENNYSFIDLRLGTQDVGDLIGLADFEVDEKTGKKVSTKFMPPDWLKSSIDYALSNPKSKAIIFLDEINRAPRDVLQAIFPLVLDGRMHQVELPVNAHCISAMNPDTDDYVTTDLSDKALIDRFCHIKVDPTVKEWLDFAGDNNFDSDIIGFISEQKGLLDSKTENFDLQFVTPSRRSWDALSRLKQTGIDNDLFVQLSMGIVGVAATSALQSYLKNSDKPFTAKDVLSKYSTIKEKIKKYSNPTTETNGRLDLLSNTCDSLLKYFEKNKKTPTKKQQQNLKEFLFDIPIEVSWDFSRKFFKDNIETNDWFQNFEDLTEYYLKQRDMLKEPTEEEKK